MPDAIRTANAIANAHDLTGTPERFAAGSVPVFGVGSFVIKLFPADESAFFDTERAALAAVAGAVRIPTPRLIATGQHDGWHYIVMTRLSGHALVDVWDRIESAARLRIAETVGGAIADLRAVSASGVPSTSWDAFLQVQRTQCVEVQTSKGLDTQWVDRIEPFLRTAPALNEPAPVLLHTEIMREHLLVDRVADRWELTGLVDFEPAMVGAPEYELASVGLFVTCAEPGLFRAVVEASGQDWDDELPLRVMTYALLHRYSNVRWYLERVPPPDDVQTFEALASYWFGVC